MNFTTTLTSKNQFTLPKSVRDKLGLKQGTKINIFPTLDGGFIAKPQEQSSILMFAGDLVNLDDGKSLKTIRAEAEKRAAKEWINEKRPYDKNRSLRH